MMNVVHALTWSLLSSFIMMRHEKKPLPENKRIKIRFEIDFMNRILFTLNVRYYIRKNINQG